MCELCLGAPNLQLLNCEYTKVLYNVQVILVLSTLGLVSMCTKTIYCVVYVVYLYAVKDTTSCWEVNAAKRFKYFQMCKCKGYHRTTKVFIPTVPKPLWIEVITQYILCVRR